ncbi:MAG TPA: ThuA domain-containing protein [Polyangia bacterium]|jgi:hypothetical protein|nr:ThuA domain-containing protein [Polyangia bacterium]
MRQQPGLAFVFRQQLTLALVAVLSGCTSANPGAPAAPSDAAIESGRPPTSSTGGAAGTVTGAGGQDAGLGGSGGTAGAHQPDATMVTTDASDAPSPPVRPGKALIYIFSNLYFRHPSIEPAANTLAAALTPLGFTSEISKDQAKFSTAGLADYSLVIMIGSCGTPLGQPEMASVAALDAWIKAGGGLVGIHAASAVAYPPSSRFVAIMGGRFVGHPGNLRQSVCMAQGTHPAVVNLPMPYTLRDEIYVHDGYNPTNQVDLQCAGVDGAPLPIAWHRTEGMGRVFYSALGHELDTWKPDSVHVKTHVLPGILWAAGR